jgi:hypothetical protein
MEVLVQFERAYAGRPSDAVWIVGTPENRTWFEQHVGSIDANSAVFDDNAAPLTVIGHVFDHHPDWTEIVVRGAALTAEIEQGVQPDAVVATRGFDEFRLTRP